MKQIITLYKALVFLGTTLSGLAMLVVGVAGITASVDRTYFTLAAISFPFIACVAALFWLLSLLSMRWKLLLFQTLCFALSAPMLLHTFGFNVTLKPAPETSIKIMTYNVDGFNQEEGKPTQMLNYIRAKQPDILCFQEFSARPEKYGFTLQQICENLPEYPYFDFQQHNTTRFHSGVGTAVFSKFPILAVEPIVYESRINSSCLYRLDIRGKQLILINNHLESNGLSEMDIHFIRKLVKNMKFDYAPLVDEIVKGKIENAAKKRMEQVTFIQQKAEDSGGEHIIICGDLNDTPLSPTLRLFREQYADAFRKAGQGMGATHRMVRSGLRIDYFLHSPNITPYRYEVFKADYSDHYPTFCSFTLD